VWISKKRHEGIVAVARKGESDARLKVRENASEFQRLMRALEVILPESIAPSEVFFIYSESRWDYSHIIAAAEAVRNADNKVENDTLVELVKRMKDASDG